ncbi:MAG TPA: nucleotide sugar dehydrogenase [Candidatus Angelobacter sp.]|nr:nucleotide sugar dehydrogenase [Candidatus Angelobacter sp.]
MTTSLLAVPAQSFVDRIQSRKAKIGIIGLGYVGLPLALLFAEEGFPVLGFDIDSQKVEALVNGESYIYRVPKTEIQLAQRRGFNATSDYALASGMDAIVICVPTPLDEHRQPDLSYVRSTVESIAPHLRAGQLVVLESTTYPGTTEELVVPIVEKMNRAECGVARNGQPQTNSIFVAFSPEREDPGNDIIARRDVPKVVGGIDARATELARELYAALFHRVVTVSAPAVAEMTKLLENIYRCVNIALVNELKLLCLRMGIDVWEVIDAAATKPFGFQPFYPGPGLGGHCIPIDPFYLSWKAQQWDFQMRFIELAGEINTAMPRHVVEAVSSALNSRNKPVNGSRVLVLGVSYKKDIDDLRESPALTIIELLRAQGAVVSYHDPFFPFLDKGRKYNLQLRCSSLENLGHYDCVLIVTDHSTYDYEEIVDQAQLIVDTRNATRGINSAKVVRC